MALLSKMWTMDPQAGLVQLRHCIVLRDRGGPVGKLLAAN